jgi:hypothetical protein
VLTEEPGCHLGVAGMDSASSPAILKDGAIGVRCALRGDVLPAAGVRDAVAELRRE